MLRHDTTVVETTQTYNRTNLHFDGYGTYNTTLCLKERFKVIITSIEFPKPGIK